MEQFGVEDTSAGITTDSDNTMKGARRFFKSNQFTIAGCGCHGYHLVIEEVLKDPAYEHDRKDSNSIMSELKNKPKLRHQLFIRVNSKALKRREELEQKNYSDEEIDLEMESFATEQRFGVPLGCWTRWGSFVVVFGRLIDWKEMGKFCKTLFSRRTDKKEGLQTFLTH